ncbi:hypothetical protein GGS20DRAFT_21836 [Poronia punctata]|nr:hypothetical protein GGS20DRAFT_21836 [Poronia punctata]
MSAAATSATSFAAILNPLNNERVQIFRAFPKTLTVGYEQRPISGQAGTYITRGNADPVKVPSAVLSAPSSIVALQYDDTVNVYGVTAKEKLVSLVSPIVEPVSPPMKSNTGYIAGCTNGTNAYIYFQQVDADNKVVISFSDVSDPDSNNETLPITTSILPNTWLGSFWDGERAWVLYQEGKVGEASSSRLQAYNTDAQTSSPLGKAAKDFIDHTPIGCGFVSAENIDRNVVQDFTSTALGRVYVYWVNDINGKKTLYRSHSDISSGAIQTTFSDPVQVGQQAVGVQEAAQISVVVDKNTQQNRVYIARSGSGEKDKISMYADNFYYAKKKEDGK